MLLSEYLNAWSDLHNETLRPSSAASCRLTLKHLLCALPPDLTLAELHPLQCKAAYTKVANEGKLRTAQLMYQLLKQALEDAVDMGYITRNPMARLKKPAHKPQEAAYFEPHELKRIVTADSPWRLAWVLMGLFGLRRGECAALQWSDIDLTARTIHVHRSLNRIDGETIVGPTKSDEGDRLLPIPEQLIEMFVSHRTQQKKTAFRKSLGWSEKRSVCTPDGKFLKDPRSLNRYLRKDLAAMNLPGAGCHALRHSFAAANVAAGTSLKHLQKLMGHSNITITSQVYAHTKFADLSASIDHTAHLTLNQGVQGSSP